MNSHGERVTGTDGEGHRYGQQEYHHSAQAFPVQQMHLYISYNNDLAPIRYLM